MTDIIAWQYEVIQAHMFASTDNVHTRECGTKPRYPFHLYKEPLRAITEGKESSPAFRRVDRVHGDVRYAKMKIR